MAENAFAETIIPGTFVRVLSEGLIGVGGISTGTIGIVGTAATGVGETHLLADYASGRAAFGNYDAYAAGAGTLNLTRALEVLYRNGAGNVFARGVAAGAAVDVFDTAFAELAKEDVNLVVAPELSTADARGRLEPLVGTAESHGRDLLAIVGSDAAIKAEAPTNGRVVLTTPGIQAFDAAAKALVMLDGRYSAAAVAGLLSTLSPESSPTNKTLPGVQVLAQRFSYADLTELVKGRIMALEDRQGIRIVRGLTTDDGPFKQVTTRRITDYAKAGMRQAADPFIGRLNNQRVRKALRGAIDGFLTTMVVAEQLIAYTLDVTATRADEIAGRAVVTAVLLPTFSIDYVMVTLVLQ
jgi:hypothetical protein